MNTPSGIVQFTELAAPSISGAEIVHGARYSRGWLPAIPRLLVFLWIDPPDDY
jgi:hypothetical protein